MLQSHCVWPERALNMEVGPYTRFPVNPLTQVTLSEFFNSLEFAIVSATVGRFLRSTLLTNLSSFLCQQHYQALEGQDSDSGKVIISRSTSSHYGTGETAACRVQLCVACMFILQCLPFSGGRRSVFHCGRLGRWQKQTGLLLGFTMHKTNICFFFMYLLYFNFLSMEAIWGNLWCYVCPAAALSFSVKDY